MAVLLLDDGPFKGRTATEARSELYQDSIELIYHGALLSRVVYAFNAKVFGAVLINVLPALIFFKMADTIESRSS